MLKVDNLSKSFKDVHAVKEANFEIREGEVIGLVGPNGAGKTTLIKCICTILNADSGTIHINGYDLYEDPVKAKMHIAYIPEVPNPFEYLTVWEHIGFSARAYFREDWEADADRYLDMFNLMEKKYTLVNTLSKGQKQKMQIICAFIHNPRLIFMDEPLIGIDPEGAYAMKELIKDFISRGTTFLISSHMLGLIEELCTSIMVMQKGTIIWQGSIEEIKRMESTGDLEEAFISITKPYRSSVEDAFEKENDKPSIANLFFRRRKKR